MVRRIATKDTTPRVVRREATTHHVRSVVIFHTKQDNENMFKRSTGALPLFFLTSQDRFIFFHVLGDSEEFVDWFRHGAFTSRSDADDDGKAEAVLATDPAGKAAVDLVGRSFGRPRWRWEE